MPPLRHRVCCRSIPTLSGLIPAARLLLQSVLRAKSLPPMFSAFWPKPDRLVLINCASASWISRNVRDEPRNSRSSALRKRVRLPMTRGGIGCRHNHDFAAGRAAVKPACRFRQARGLRRGSEYGGSVQSTLPSRAKPNLRWGSRLHENPTGLHFPPPQPAGSVSELKPLGNQCEVRPAFV